MRGVLMSFLSAEILGIFFLFQGCSNPSLNKMNYGECRPHLEEAREEAKTRETYSHSHEDYEECRHPAWFQQPQSEEDDE